MLGVEETVAGSREGVILQTGVGRVLCYWTPTKASELHE